MANTTSTTAAAAGTINLGGDLTVHRLGYGAMRITDRASEPLVDLCEQEALAFLPWAPILDLDDNHAVKAIAGRLGASPRQVALAWLLGRSPTMLPIPGTGSVAHLEANIAAAGHDLTPQDIAAITQ
jgi:aryl-alcohol dehydrogenase-like predicted oxidoreductase